MDNVLLKCCPFCGGGVHFEHLYQDDNHRYPREFWHVRISCCLSDTGWRKYGEQENESNDPEAKAKAEAALAEEWNSRVES